MPERDSQDWNMGLSEFRAGALLPQDSLSHFVRTVHTAVQTLNPDMLTSLQIWENSELTPRPFKPQASAAAVPQMVLLTTYSSLLASLSHLQRHN